MRVLPGAELAVGSGLHRAVVAGEAVLLARLDDGRAVCVTATCPHQATDLGDGDLVGEGRVRCRLHHYEYDVVTGENVVPTREVDPAKLWKAAPGYLRVFPVEERDGWVWVGTVAGPPPPSFDPGREREPVGTASPAVATGPGAVEAVEVARGTTVELRLPAPGRPGFVWRVDVRGPAVAVVGERVERGAPSTHVVRLAGRAVGRATVRCTYARPWDRVPADVRTYEVTVSE